MASVDTKEYLANGGYLQKGANGNLVEADLGKEVYDLLPSRFRNPGDYLTLEMFGWPLFLIKDKEGNINAFHNVCRHRGHPVTTKESGSTTVLACRFHGWTYLPDGALHTAREYMSLPKFSPAGHSLFKIHTHVTSQGFIFINFDAGPTPSISFAAQFGDDFSPIITSHSNSETNSHIDEYELFGKDSWTYDHIWESSTAGTRYNWKTFADGFQECYHCATGHPSTLPRDFSISSYYLRQGFGASRHFLPLKPEKEEEMGESYITWLYTTGAIIFTGTPTFIARLDSRGALDTRYQSETYRKKDLVKPSPEYDEWIAKDVGYWRFVEVEDVELAVTAQRGFMNGVLGRGRLYSVQEHAVKWYQDKVKETLSQHGEMEMMVGKAVDYSIPKEQGEFEEADPVCKMIGPEIEW